MSHARARLSHSTPVNLERLTFAGLSLLLRPLSGERALGPMQVRLVALPRVAPNHEWMNGCIWPRRGALGPDESEPRASWPQTD